MILNDAEVRPGGKEDDLYFNGDLRCYVLLGQRSRT